MAAERGELGSHVRQETEELGKKKESMPGFVGHVTDLGFC